MKPFGSEYEFGASFDRPQDTTASPPPIPVAQGGLTRDQVREAVLDAKYSTASEKNTNWQKAADALNALLATNPGGLTRHEAKREQLELEKRLADFIWEAYEHPGSRANQMLPTELAKKLVPFIEREIALATNPGEKGAESPLREFAIAVIDSYLDGGDMDGLEIEELAAKLGLLEGRTVKEECCENCACAEIGFPTTCYRKSKVLLGATPSSTKEVEND